MSIFSEIFFTIFVNTLHISGKWNEDIKMVSIYNYSRYVQGTDLAYFLQNLLWQEVGRVPGLSFVISFQIN